MRLGAKKWSVLAALGCTVAGLAFITTGSGNYHSDSELRFFGEMADSLPAIYNGLFATSGKCEKCHGHDPEGIASVSLTGEDVNVVDAWRSYMMANSAKDPYWRAKVRQEVLTNPAHQVEIENTCTKCHAPLGRHAIGVTGLSEYSFNHMLTDTAGLDGVSCVACHQRSTFNLGNENSGNLHFESQPIAYGPFESPLVSPMALFSGYTPVESAHISDAGICGDCHTLITNTVDLSGNLTGTTFIEQATYHEWLNSAYDEGQELQSSCQDCHMPSLGDKDPIRLAAGYATPYRAPFSKHEFAGANYLMLGLMNENKDTLGILATADDYAATIEATENMLKDGLELEVLPHNRDGDSTYLHFSLRNLAGHKYPSGYPARRLYLELTVASVETGEILFSSGENGLNNVLPDEDESFEPHYDVIRSEDQMQIYEMVMGDVNGDFTTILERAATHLKDNRLVPRGFKVSDAQYDSTAVVGVWPSDENFNYASGIEGSGTDEIRYHIASNGNHEALQITIRALYHSVPFKWVDGLSGLDDPFVQHFQEMFAESNTAPFEVASETFIVSSWSNIDEEMGGKPRVFVSNSTLIVENVADAEVMVFSMSGQLVAKSTINGNRGMVRYPFVAGIYSVVIRTNGREFIEKVYFP
ncbi:MAG: hypothetical protein RL226_665 [Bacteroidota bacterium]